jgi:hypothetical protein
MKVYTLEMGVYSDRSLVGVFRTLEAAQQAALPQRGKFYRGMGLGREAPVSEVEWTEASWTLFGPCENEWINNGDMDDAAAIRLWKLQ